MAVAARYTEDAQVIAPGAPLANGRKAIAAFWQASIDSGVSDVALETAEVESVGDLAYEAPPPGCERRRRNEGPLRSRLETSRREMDAALRHLELIGVSCGISPSLQPNLALALSKRSRVGRASRKLGDLVSLPTDRGAQLAAAGYLNL